MSSKIEISGITELPTAEVQKLHDQLQQALLLCKRTIQLRTVGIKADQLQASVDAVPFSASESSPPYDPKQPVPEMSKEDLQKIRQNYKTWRKTELLFEVSRLCEQVDGLSKRLARAEAAVATMNANAGDWDERMHQARVTYDALHERLEQANQDQLATEQKLKQCCDIATDNSKQAEAAETVILDAYLTLSRMLPQLTAMEQDVTVNAIKWVLHILQPKDDNVETSKAKTTDQGNAAV